MATTSDHALIVALLRRGWTVRAVAERAGVTERTVQRVKAANGLSAPPPTPLSEAELARVAELLAQGCSISEAARTIGRCQTNLNYRFRGRGYTDEQTRERRSLLALERKALTR